MKKNKRAQISKDERASFLKKELREFDKEQLSEMDVKQLSEITGGIARYVDAVVGDSQPSENRQDSLR